MPDDFQLETISLDDARPQFGDPVEVETPLDVESNDVRPVRAGKPKVRDRVREVRIPKVTRREEKEISARFQKMLVHGTGIPAVVRPHFQMTDDEAQDIAEPLAAYLARQQDASAFVREFLDRYDLIAFGLATLTYLVRVWIDDDNYRKQQRLANPKQRRTASSGSAPTRDHRGGPPGTGEAGEGSPGDVIRLETSGNDDAGQWVSTPVSPGQI